MRVRADLVAGPVALIVKINGRGNLSMECPDLYQISVAVVQSQELTIIKDAVLFYWGNRLTPAPSAVR